MLIKKKNNYLKYFLFIISIGIFLLMFTFRVYLIDQYLKLAQNYFPANEAEAISLAEKEELLLLRNEVATLKDEVKKVREEFSVGLIDEEKSPVYMLLGHASLYGDFYVSLPENKTPYTGMSIFSEGNVVVGQVVEILNNSLRISRMGQTSSFIASSLEGDENLELRSLGSGLYVGSVSGGSKISLGDTIVMKGYPKSIVGTVVEITKGNSSLSNIFVRTPYNINNREIFYVIQ